MAGKRRARRAAVDGGAARPATLVPRLLYGIFALSGFAGLIYESAWTRYLQLFLGHAAYAQVLVIALIMGGMGTGALLASRLSRVGVQPIFLYACAEAALGVAGFAFDPLYQASTALAYDAWLPAAQSLAASRGIEWSLAAALILPQSVLLGMTFPMMSAAVLRASRAPSGRVFALLYSSNSIGAVAGVLLSAFWLIETLGLPGTMAVAGSANLFVAAAAAIVGWFAQRRAGVVATVAAVAAVAARPPDPPVPSNARDDPRGHAGGILARRVLAIAFLTAVSSFFYEIAWLRMMALVEGASTHAFETMLSAFILGIAIGGWAIRRRIDALADPVRALAIVQVAMGVAAIATLFIYPLTFEGMRIALMKLPRTDAGYAGFNAIGWLLSAAVMLPASVFAGMTLPLLTAILYARSRGEREIGRVYGWNTLGSIAGVVLGGLWLLPALGLKNLVVAGASIDIAVGIGLAVGLGRSLPSAKATDTGRRAAPRPRIPLAVAMAAVAAFAIVAALLDSFDRDRLISGVFRTGRTRLPPGSAVLDYADGRTATVGVIRLPNDKVAISTNGKIDAAINLDPRRGQALGPDEFTMALAAILPLAHRPGARRVAVIGHGSGLSAHVILGSPNVERVDTIEIEPEMIREARHFLPRVSRTYEDPRSRFHVDDARAFFARPADRYDIIVSEPSNPWVSGVASLFTAEFYRHAGAALEPDGVFVQWFHLYETDRTLVRSIVGALAQVFSDYAIYATNEDDAVIVATRSGTLPPLDDAWFGWPGLAPDRARLDLRAPDQLRFFRVANRRGYAPMLERDVVNRDMKPILEFGAARARFIRSSDTPLLDAARDAVPVNEILSGFDPPSPPTASLLIGEALPRFADAMRGAAIAQTLAGTRALSADDGLSPVELRALRRARDFDANTSDAEWNDWFIAVAILSKPVLVNGSAAVFAEFIRAPATQRALARAPASIRDKVDLLMAVGARDLERIQRIGVGLLAAGAGESDHGFTGYTLLATAAACISRPVDPGCGGAIALLDRVEGGNFQIDLLRAHRDATARSSVR